MMLPPLCLYKILVLLEHQTSAGSSSNAEVWLWVACLAVSKLIHFGLDTW